MIKSPNFMIIPSLSCQAACKYCFGPNKGKTMDIAMVNNSLDYIKRIVNETGQDKVNITLHGGEPLMAGHEIIKSILVGIDSRFDNANVGIQSNLWLLDDEYCRLFKKYHVNISTSLDGPKEINDRQRGEGYFDNTMRGINLARKYVMNCGCIATFTALSAPKYKEVVDFFISNNMHFSVHGAVNTYDVQSDYDISPSEYAILLKDIFEWYKENSNRIKISTLDQMCQSVSSNNGRVCSFCDCFGMFLVIDPYGDIYSCQRFAGNSKYSLGNIGDKPVIDELIDNDMGQRIIKHQKDVKNECKDCEHYKYCKGGCTYNAIMSNRPVDIYCDTYKAVFDYIKNGLYQEMISPANEIAIAKYGASSKGNPLLREGKLININKEGAHPYDVARRAKRIVACYELGKNNDFELTLQSLYDMELGQSKQTLRDSLLALKTHIDDIDNLNKAYIHVTWNCQLKCSHCYANAGNCNKDSDMKSKDIVNLIKQCTKEGFDSVVITGGEPLILKDISGLLGKLIQIRKDSNLCKIALRTNFSMPLTNKILLMIGEAFDEIVVSVDGDKQSHDARRGQGSYDKTVNNISQYMNAVDGVSTAKISLSSAMLEREAFGREGKHVRYLANKYGIKKVKFTPILPLGRANENRELLEDNYFKLDKLSIDILEDRIVPHKTCGIGQNLYIQPTGDTYPCYAYCPTEAYLGNVVKDGIENIINSVNFTKMREYSVDKNEKCKSCRYRYLCGGMCIALCKNSTCELCRMQGDCTTLKLNYEALYKTSLDYLSIDY